MLGFAVVLDGFISLWVFVYRPFGSYMQCIAWYIERNTQWEMTVMSTSFRDAGRRACLERMFSELNVLKNHRPVSS